MNSNMRSLAFKDNYPNVEYSVSEFLMDTSIIRNLIFAILQVTIMQGTLNPEYGKTVPVVFCSLKIGMPELWRILCVESTKHIKGVKDLNPFFISTILRNLLSLKRICPACKRGQIVSSGQKRKPVKCKFCGATIPARSTD
jgi:hypothetical protein